MAIEYSIVINKIETEEVDNLSDIVRRIFWKFKGVDTVTGNIAMVDNVDVFVLKEETWINAEGETQSNHVDFDPNNFLRYEDLTPTIVEQWIRSKHTQDMHVFEQGVNRRLAELNARTQKQPTASSGRNLPWVNAN